MSKWQTAPDGRERRRITMQDVGRTLSGWAYRQTEVEASSDRVWVEWDQSFLTPEYVDKGFLDDIFFVICHDCNEMIEIVKENTSCQDWLSLHVGHALGVTDDESFCYV